MVYFFKIKTEKCKSKLLFIFLICFFVVGFQSCQSSKNAELLPEPKFKYRSIGEQIRNERIERGLSLKDLAEAVKMSQEALSLIEDGLATPIHHKMLAIEEFFGIEFVYDKKLSIRIK